MAGHQKTHPEGEHQTTLIARELNRVAVDTHGGRVHIEWDQSAAVTPYGQLAFFIEFLKTTSLFDDWVTTCPLKLTSPNASKVRDILGTVLLSVLSGHTRYSHITTVRSDQVNAPLLGMSKIVAYSQDVGHLLLSCWTVTIFHIYLKFRFYQVSNMSQGFTLSHRLTIYLNNISIVSDAITNCISNGIVTNKMVPFIYGQLCGNYC